MAVGSAKGGHGGCRVEDHMGHRCGHAAGNIEHEIPGVIQPIVDGRTEQPQGPYVQDQMQPADDDAPTLLISSYGNDQLGTRWCRLGEFCRPYLPVVAVLITWTAPLKTETFGLMLQLPNLGLSSKRRCAIF